MSKFLDTLRLVKDENLTKPQLEDYHKLMSELRGEMRLELADITKKKAMYLINNLEQSVAQRIINWKATELGQREIELKAYIGTASDNLGALKARLFSVY